jgi:hypothetical protein
MSSTFCTNFGSVFNESVRPSRATAYLSPMGFAVVLRVHGFRWSVFKRAVRYCTTTSKSPVRLHFPTMIMIVAWGWNWWSIHNPMQSHSSILFHISTQDVHKWFRTPRISEQ